eukprot:TRINITY_DN682_c0_g4_i1.p1 TRINITY_DN682_c0_g4~~TRINITY_DN682_c0_g4_i1.p1  ORF type:complete len:179 (-),score=48.63 TRINITY_DN682_c0_g4_i1:558-1094(-)
MVLKFGRSRYKVERIVVQECERALGNEEKNVRVSVDANHVETNQGEPDEILLADIKLTIEEVKLIKESKSCRICLSGDNHPENPLVTTLCKCTGTANAIHVDCLQQWLKSKIKVRQRPSVTSYYWKPFHCEICKAKYPDIIQLSDGKQLQVFDIRYPNVSYMVLQNDTLVRTNGKVLT